MPSNQTLKQVCLASVPSPLKGWGQEFTEILMNAKIRKHFTRLKIQRKGNIFLSLREIESAIHNCIDFVMKMLNVCLFRNTINVSGPNMLHWY